MLIIEDCIKYVGDVRKTFQTPARLFSIEGLDALLL